MQTLYEFDVVVMGADDDPLVGEGRIGPGEEPGDVARRDLLGLRQRHDADLCAGRRELQLGRALPVVDRLLHRLQRLPGGKQACSRL